MTLHPQHLGLDPAGLKSKQFLTKQILWKSLLMFSTTYVHLDVGVFLRAYSALGMLRL